MKAPVVVIAKQHQRLPIASDVGNRTIRWCLPFPFCKTDQAGIKLGRRGNAMCIDINVMQVPAFPFDPLSVGLTVGRSRAASFIDDRIDLDQIVKRIPNIELADPSHRIGASVGYYVTSHLQPLFHSLSVRNVDSKMSTNCWIVEKSMTLLKGRVGVHDVNAAIIGSEYSKFNATDQTWEMIGDVVDANGGTPNCRWDKANGGCR